MKKFFYAAAFAAVSALSLSSCCTTNYPVYSSATPDLGSKVGEASSTSILFLFSKNGKNATLKDAAKSAGITKVNHVETTVTNYVGGIVSKRTTRVYGE